MQWRALATSWTSWHCRALEAAKEADLIREDGLDGASSADLARASACRWCSQRRRHGSDLALAHAWRASSRS